MPDWIGTDRLPAAARYRAMAEHELRGVSPSYERLCLGVAEDAEIQALIDALPVAKRQPNLLLAAVRFLGGTVSSWPEFREFVTSSWADVSACMLARRTQTNEAGRCATLLPVLAGLPGPLALLEVGASAGLCLYPDRFAYRYDSAAGSHALGAGPELRCATTGPVPLPDRLPDIIWRGGLDLNPLDVCDDEDVRWLDSLIWPEQTVRFAVLEHAVTLARADPPQIAIGDLTTDLAAAAARVPADATLVIFHSAVLAYVDDDGRRAFIDQVHNLAAERPTSWISNEGPGVVPGTEQPSGGPSRFVVALDGNPLARSGPHGHTLDWLPSGRQSA